MSERLKALIHPTTLGIWALLGFLVYQHFYPAVAPGPVHPSAFAFRAAGKSYAADGARAFSKALREASAAANKPAADLGRVKADLVARHTVLRSAAFDGRFVEPLDAILPPQTGAGNPPTPTQISNWAAALSSIADGLDDAAKIVESK